MEREAVPLLLPPSTIAWFHYKSTLATDLNRTEQQIVHHTPSHEVHICTLFDVKSICIFLLSSYSKLFVNINTDIQQEQKEIQHLGSVLSSLFISVLRRSPFPKPLHQWTAVLVAVEQKLSTTWYCVNNIIKF